MNVEYSLAMSEALCIINQSDDYKNKIPNSFLNFMKENAEPNYNPDFNINIPIKELNLRKETKGILALIYRTYICTDEQKIEYDSLLKQNEQKMQEELKEKYDIYKIFNERQQKNVVQEPEFDNQTKEMVKYNKESIFRRIFNKIKSLFKKR